MGRLRDHSINLAGQILKRAKDHVVKKVKEHTKKKVKEQVGRVLSEGKRRASGSKTRAEKRDYSQDINAKLSALAYEKDPAKLRRAARKLGFDVDDELSTANHTVFKNRKTGSVTISYRGTDPSNVDDLLADKDIALGKRDHQRFKDALHVAKQTQKKYGADKVDVTGHSLGGTQALHVYETLVVNARVYNPGAAPKNQTFKKHQYGKAEIVRHEDDLVSLGYAPYASETYKTDDLQMPNLLKAHNIPGQK